MPLFSIMEHPILPARLVREIADAIREIGSSPRSYVESALLPDSTATWFPARLARSLSGSVAEFAQSPATYVRTATSPDIVGIDKRKYLKPILTVSAAAHFVLIAYLFYVAVLSPFARLRVVDKPYRELDIQAMLAPLRYPPQMLRGPLGERPMSLEEIRERDRKRRELLERRKREEAEEEARRKEAEEKRKAEEARKAAEKPATPNSGQFGEINVAPIKDIVGKIYETYHGGQLNLDWNTFSIMARFKIEKDGSIPQSSIGVIKSSGSKVIDQKAIEILWRLGESHALGPLSSLSSNTIKLEVNESAASLTITSFAPSPGEAESTAKALNFFLGIFRATQRSKSPNVADLLGMLRVTSNNNRVDARMSISRARADEMMKAQYGGSATTTPP